MATGLSAAIRSLVSDRGVSEELVLQTIEEFLFAAYKRKYGTNENAVVKFDNDGDEVTLFAKKTIVEDVEDDVLEISLEEALGLNDQCEVGDELLIEIDPKSFDRIAVQSAKQKAKQTLREIQKDTLYSEFKGKEGELVIGYFQREKNGDVFIDLGKTEGILPKRFQSPREIYRRNDRVKTLIQSVEKNTNGYGIKILLSRTHTDFVKRLFELEVPELYDHTVEIFKIVREPGYRTKLAVYSNRDDIDPVGACVGLKGVRIQTIVRELEGEKIDVLKYETDPFMFIKNALSPAEVKQIYILDEAKRTALAVVPESQLSLAIGKQGLNVRLANRLADWSIDVKTEEQFMEMDIMQDSKRELDALFSDEVEEIVNISDLPGADSDVVNILETHGIVSLEDYINLSEKDLSDINGLTDDAVDKLNEVMNEYVDIVEEDTDELFDDDIQQEDEEEDFEELPDDDDVEEDSAEIVYEDTFECPECGHPLTEDMTACPNCGVGLSFEESEEIEE